MHHNVIKCRVIQIIKNALRFNLRGCKFSGGHAPRPHRFGMLRMHASMCALHKMEPSTFENIPMPLTVQLDLNFKHASGQHACLL